MKNLATNKSLLNFIKTTAYKERLFIETTENEFLHFFQSLDHDTKTQFSKLDPDKFKIYNFEASRIEQIEKFKNYDFALVKNSDRAEYVLYHTPTSTTIEIGWASWRQIDIDFYMAVYAVMRNELYPKNTFIREYIAANNSDTNR